MSEPAITEKMLPLGAHDQPSIAVAFGGGGARGIAHIHVVEVLDELGLKPVAISGASIGAIIGTAMAAGMSGREIREYVLATVGHRGEVASRIWSTRPHGLKDMLARPFRLGQFDAERILKAFLPEAVPECFEDLKIPVKIVVTDYYAQCEHVCETGSLYGALAASCALPAVFRPVRLNGRVMIDGGIYNPVPFDHLRGLADVTIGVDVVGGPYGDQTRVPKMIDAMFGASQLMMQSIISMKLKAAPPDILLRPDVSRYRVMEFMRVAEILEATSGVRDDLKYRIDAAFKAHCRRVSH